MFPIERLKELGRKMRELPEGFVMQRQVAKVIDDRLENANWRNAIELGCC